MPNLPWFSMYPTDFLVSTATLTAVQGWAYTQLLMYAWTNGGIPDNRETCARMTRCDITSEDWAVLRARFVLEKDGMLSHPRLEQERNSATDRRARASERATVAAKSRWKGKRDAPSMPDECDEHASSMPTTTTTTTTNNPPTPRKRGDVVEEFDWKPPTDQLDRIARSNPTIATRLERARSGDLFARELDGTRKAVSAEQVMADARDMAHKAIVEELTDVMRVLCNKGLTGREALRIWEGWFAKWATTGVRPKNSLSAELADKSIRNHVAVWKKRAAA